MRGTQPVGQPGYRARMTDRFPPAPETTTIVALVEARSPVIRYIGQSVDPRPRFVKQALGHRKDFCRIVLHEEVDVGDVAAFYQQEEIAHAVRAGHPLLNDLGLPVNLLSDDRVVRAARNRALATIADGDGTTDQLQQHLETDRAMCEAQAAAWTSGVRQPLAHPTWRYDVRPIRTTEPPPGFDEVEDDLVSRAPLLDISSVAADVRALLERFAVVWTAEGLTAIADSYVMWPDGQRARHNRDATEARFVRGDAAELRLPHRDLGAILDRHVPGATDRLGGMKGMKVGRRNSLILTTTDTDQLDLLADMLIDMAVVVNASTAKPVRQRTTSHDSQQVLLRASQAIVLNAELREARLR